MTVLVAVSGNLCSGKTTTAELLADHLKLQFAETRDYHQSYLADQFSNPKRWSFETQMALLGAKARGMRDAFEVASRVIVDRTLDEDAQIFARYFVECGYLDERAYSTYLRYADLLSEGIPSPNVLIYCRCPPNECRRRLGERPRPYQRLYPPDFLDFLHNAYEQWWERASADIKIRIDTDLHDLRIPDIGKSFGDHVASALLEQEQLASGQLSLFSVDNIRSTALDARDFRLDWKGNQRLSTKPGRGLGTPRIYIAAPFTGATISDSPSPSGDQGTLIRVAEPHGIIPRNEYRDILMRTARALRRKGYGSFLPHRDINKWGTRIMTPREIANECILSVQRSQILLGLLGQSFGAHVEAAVALASGIPTILVHIREQDESFFAGALRDSGFCVTVTLQKMTELPTFVSSAAFDELVREALQKAAIFGRSSTGDGQ